MTDETEEQASQYVESDNDYSFSDFTSILTHADVKDHIKPTDIIDILYGFGKSEEGYAQWDGGFVVSLKNGNRAILYGGCDTTGWGCQDNASVAFCLPEDLEETIEKLNLPALTFWDSNPQGFWEAFRKVDNWEDLW
jgi:hypothetical protein